MKIRPPATNLQRISPMRTIFKYKTFFALVLFMAVNVSFYLGMAAGDDKNNYLADRHQVRGMNCTSCHKESPPKASVPATVCTGCHGPYAKLAERTKKAEHNPHASHQGDLACDACHHAHKTSVDQCSSCHTFGLKVP